MDCTDAFDRLALSRAQGLAGLEAPGPFEESLPPEDFVEPRHATVKIVGDVEHHRVAVGDEGIQRQDFRRDGTGRHRKLQPLQQQRVGDR